jgi:thiosulfate/3-mercaptopyruvate sulfurtransferase
MLTSTRYCAVLVFAASALLAQTAAAADAPTGSLASVDWLAANLKNPDVVIIDTSPEPMYKAKHIPGAQHFEIFGTLAFGAREKSLADSEAMYQSLGISPGKKVVIYDEGGTWYATRLFFSLEYDGFPVKDMAILNGGLSKWQQQGQAVTAEATPAPARGSYKIAQVDESIRARLPEFLTASGDTTNNALLEALGADWHFGESRFFSKGGHVPNAIMSPGEDYFNADKTFKSPQEIRQMLAYLSIRPEQQVYTHCGGGGAAAVPFFALRNIAGYSKVKMYGESEMGWLSDPRDLPYWTYDAPYMMRETGWLQAWGGKMLRSYGMSDVSVIDVRPAAAFAQGHMPYALSVPAELFRDNLGHPEKLAQILGAAGVKSSDELVVVAGSGITRDSALAYAALQELGQKKVSVFTDSMESPEAIDKMAQQGFALTKETQPAAKAPAFTMSVRKDVFVASPVEVTGDYPKVFIDSGKQVSAKAPQGKVVHVPYTDLLNADGTPKAAKDIWNILVKAGVPRYAEILCFSDDPGEAAANYFVLKLMGYPDVRVLAI